MGHDGAPRSPQPSRHADTPTASTGPPPSPPWPLPPCPLPAQVVQGSADSIWSNTVLASYVYELMVKTPTPNTYAGYVEAAQGLSNLVVALPVGWAADKGSKVS